MGLIENKLLLKHSSLKLTQPWTKSEWTNESLFLFKYKTASEFILRNSFLSINATKYIKQIFKLKKY